MSDSEERVEDSVEEDSSTEAEPMDPVNADEEPEKLSPYVPGPDAVDITPDQDGGVMKEIKRCGSGDDHPMTGDKVFVHYVGTLADGTKFDSSRDRGQQFEFSLGTGIVLWIVIYGVYLLSHIYVIVMVTWTRPSSCRIVDSQLFHSRANSFPRVKQPVGPWPICSL